MACTYRRPPCPCAPTCRERESERASEPWSLSSYEDTHPSWVPHAPDSSEPDSFQRLRLGCSRVSLGEVGGGAEEFSPYPSSSHAGSSAPSQVLLGLKQSWNHSCWGAPGLPVRGHCAPASPSATRPVWVRGWVHAPAVLTATGRCIIFGHCRASTFSIMCAQEY